MPKDSLRRRADTLARLLADARGAEILAELQKLSLETRGAVRTDPAAPEAGASRAPVSAGGVLGAWHVAPTADGPELRRRDLPPEELRSWADVAHVPAARDSSRVVLLGESSARGFLLDPLLTPASALQRQLDAATGGYQVVDLAHTGADLRDLGQTLQQLPQAEPDIVVVYAGNNWVRSRHTPAHLDLMAGALRGGDYTSMRRAYMDRIVAPGVEQFLDRLSRVTRECGSDVIVVIPEFNLRDWIHDSELELPPLPAKDLLTWSDLRSRAEAALAAADDDGVLAITAEMTRLDGGTSPVTGHLRARAAERTGDLGAVRTALVDSRDAVCGLLATHTPRITTDIRTALTEGAVRHGFRAVDLAELLRAEDGLPDPAHFLDYCHLSSTGIEMTAAAVADIIIGHTPGHTSPQNHISAADRAIGDVLAAIHNSYYGQRSTRLAALVNSAVAVPEGRTFATSLLRLLESTGPVWASVTVSALTARPHAARYLAPMLSRSAETLGMWRLQQALCEAIGRPGAAAAEDRTVDVLRTAEQGLIEGAFQSVDHRPERAFLQGFGPVTNLGFRAAARRAVVRLTYRVPAAIRAGDCAAVFLNGHHLGELPGGPHWTSADLLVGPEVLRDGVNRIEVRWPCGGNDWADRRVEDACRLARGDYPVVRAVQGELFDLLVEMND
ncbi:hypothetical protein [Streptomyces sp. 8L]|uniref:hypothetical protein n=1 Tax=Streptomyces sp. 8L TaxID=2877242 RepID=UPI001CD3E5B2|nr:hypothetical protein [Streptomyces sp. 8L]MCA1217117.1 hypothetical protein [Streptomyces sp. 8L]